MHTYAFVLYLPNLMSLALKVLEISTMKRKDRRTEHMKHMFLFKCKRKTRSHSVTNMHKIYI